jgi:exosome complex component RRP41
MGGKGAPEKFIVKGKRLDGRKLDEIRDIEIQAGVIPNANGSCRLKIGGTEVLVSVYGPRAVIPKHKTIGDRAYLNCYYDMASFATTERNRPGPSRRSKEISMVMKSALAPSIMLEKYPKTEIDVYAIISNANAGTRCAAISAAAVALADAGIEMRDIVASVATGKIDGKIALDLSNVEDNHGDADLPITIMPHTEEVTHLQMDGDFSSEEFKKALDMAIKGCLDINKKQKAALKSKYGGKK